MFLKFLNKSLFGIFLFYPIWRNWNFLIELWRKMLVSIKVRKNSRFFDIRSSNLSCPEYQQTENWLLSSAGRPDLLRRSVRIFLRGGGWQEDETGVWTHLHVGQCQSPGAALLLRHLTVIFTYQPSPLSIYHYIIPVLNLSLYIILHQKLNGICILNDIQRPLFLLIVVKCFTEIYMNIILCIHRKLFPDFKQRLYFHNDWSWN